jgi:pantoate--beta-alanine ligase
VLKHEPLAEVDYISIADAVSLREIETGSGQPILVSLVVKMGKTRLLDNMLLPAELNAIDGLTEILGGA